MIRMTPEHIKKVSQSHMESMIEIGLNIGSGFLGSFLIFTFIVAPLWNLHTSVGDSFAITCLYTVWAIIRSFFWRRLFNRFLKNRLHKFAQEHNL